MKVAWLTFHNAINYGAALQTYASQQALMSMGINCEIIDYVNEYRGNAYNMLSHAKKEFKDRKFISSAKYIAGGIFMGRRKQKFIKFYNNNIIEYISIGEFILFEIVLFIIVTVFISILSVTISSFSKSTSNSISTTIILVVSAYMISNKGFLSNLSHLNPFVYFDISNVLQGNLAISYGNVNINFKFGVLVLGLSTIIFLIANVFLFKKNNISK